MFQAIHAHSTSACPAAAAAFSISNLVDEPGALKAQIVDLTAREKLIKDRLATRRAGAHDGATRPSMNKFPAQIVTSFESPRRLHVNNHSAAVA